MNFASCRSTPLGEYLEEFEYEKDSQDGRQEPSSLDDVSSLEDYGRIPSTTLDSSLQLQRLDQQLKSLLEFLILKEEAKLSGFRISPKPEPLASTMTLSITKSSECLDKVLWKSLALIQECEIVERGYKLAPHVPPLERLQRRIQGRSSRTLRQSLLRNCTILIKKVQDIDDVHQVDDIYDLDETLQAGKQDSCSLALLKSLLKKWSECKIDLFMNLLMQNNVEDVEFVLNSLEEAMIASTRYMLETLNIVTSLSHSLTSASPYHLTVSIEETNNLSTHEYFIRELYALCLNAREGRDVPSENKIQQEKTEFLETLHTKATRLVHELQAGINALCPPVKVDSSLDLESSSNYTPLIPIPQNQPSSSQFCSSSSLLLESCLDKGDPSSTTLVVFEGVAGLEPTHDPLHPPKQPRLSRLDRIKSRKLSLASSSSFSSAISNSNSSLDFLHELKSVLSSSCSLQK